MAEPDDRQAEPESPDVDLERRLAVLTAVAAKQAEQARADQQRRDAHAREAQQQRQAHVDRARAEFVTACAEFQAALTARNISSVLPLVRMDVRSERVGWRRQRHRVTATMTELAQVVVLRSEVHLDSLGHVANAGAVVMTLGGRLAVAQPFPDPPRSQHVMHGESYEYTFVGDVPRGPYLRTNLPSASLALAGPGAFFDALLEADGDVVPPVTVDQFAHALLHIVQEGPAWFGDDRPEYLFPDLPVLVQW